MQIKKMSAEQVIAFVKQSFGIDLTIAFAMGTSTTVSNSQELTKDTVQVVLCDYRRICGYDTAWQISVHKGEHAHMVERINVMK